MMLAMAVLAAAVTATSPAPETAEKRFEQLELQWMDALAAKDAATLEKTLAREFTIVGSSSSLDDPIGTRASWLDIAMNRPWPRHQVKVVKVLEAGEAAVVHAVLSGEYPPMPWIPKGGTLKFLITDTWVKRDGRWQVLARHSTRMADPAP